MINSNQLSNKKLRQSLKDNPTETMRLQGIEFDEGKEYIVHVNTATLLYVVMPDESITQHDFEQIQAATSLKIGTAGSVGSVASLGSLTSTVGSAGSISTAGTAGTAIDVNIN